MIHDPDRFSDAEPGNPGRELLRSMRDDGPSSGSLKRTLLAATAVSGVATTSVSAGATATVSIWAARALVASKWLSIAAVGTGIGVTATTQITRRSARHAPASTDVSNVRGVSVPSGSVSTNALALAPIAASEPPAEAHTVTSTLSSDATQTTATSPLRQAEHTNRFEAATGKKLAKPEYPGAPAMLPPDSATRPQSSAAGRPDPAHGQLEEMSIVTAPSKRERTITDEVLALDHARRALATKNLADAQRALDAYRQMFPEGQLTGEATVLRIELLVRSGDSPQATSLATRYLASYPHSPLAPRVRALITRDVDGRTNP